MFWFVNRARDEQARIAKNIQRIKENIKSRTQILSETIKCACIRFPRWPLYKGQLWQALYIYKNAILVALAYSKTKTLAFESVYERRNV